MADFSGALKMVVNVWNTSFNDSKTLISFTLARKQLVSKKSDHFQKCRKWHFF